MSMFKKEKKAKEFEEVQTVPEPKVPNFVDKENYLTALKFLNHALESGQLGLKAHKDIKLAFVIEKEDTRNGYHEPYYYTMFKKVEDIQFKSKEELDAEAMEQIQKKINSLKAEIDSKSKELAEIAKKVRG